MWNMSSSVRSRAKGYNFRIREFSAHVPIYMFTPNGDYEMMTLDQLMPKSFGPENLPSPEELLK